MRAIRLAVALLVLAWVLARDLVRERRAAMELVCPCEQAEHEAWGERGRLHLRCVCPGGG